MREEKGEEVRRKTFPVTSSSAFLRAPHSIPRAQTDALQTQERRRGQGRAVDSRVSSSKKGRAGRRRSLNLKQAILPEQSLN